MKRAKLITIKGEYYVRILTGYKYDEKTYEQKAVNETIPVLKGEEKKILEAIQYVEEDGKLYNGISIPPMLIRRVTHGVSIKDSREYIVANEYMTESKGILFERLILENTALRERIKELESVLRRIESLSYDPGNVKNIFELAKNNDKNEYF